jgi:lysozyme family protein
MEFTSSLFQKYADFVGFAEGGLSKDPNDTAKKCVGNGLFHTNRGITFCTYKELAPSMGLAPTYQRFLMLTKNEANKFLYAYYKVASKGIINPITQLIFTNIAWGSGQSVVPTLARLTLRDSLGLQNIRLTGGMNDDLRKTINAQDPIKFNNALMNQRLKWLSQAKTANVHFRGWKAREDKFRKEFMSAPGPSGGGAGIIGMLALLFGAFFFLKKT